MSHPVSLKRGGPQGAMFIKFMTEEQINTKADELFADEAFKDMVEAGVFYGRKKSKTHPRVKQYVLGNRNGIEMINLVKTGEMMSAALAAVTERVKSGGDVLFVATQPQAEEAVNVAKEFNMPVVSVRWLGGTLTNGRIISARIEHYKKLKNDLAQGLLEKYTKKERVGFEKELEKMRPLMEGLENYSGRPGVMIVVDPNLHTTAVREARHMRIPVVAFANTDTDPESVEYLVLGNTKARTAVNWFWDKIKSAVRAGIDARAAAKPAEEKEAKA